MPTGISSGGGTVSDGSITEAKLAALSVSGAKIKSSDAAAIRTAIGVGGPAPATIVNGGATVGALTTTLGGGGYGAIRFSGTVKDAAGSAIQTRGICRFTGTGVGGTFYSILDYNGTRQHTTPGAAAGVTTMEGMFTFQTDVNGVFDFKVAWTGAGPLVYVFVQCGDAVASTSGTIL